MLEWGIDFIVWVQQFHSPPLNAFFEVFTWFGGYGYLLLIPLAVWCIDHRLGWQMLLLFSANAFVNLLLKDAIGLPRPFEVDPRVVSDGELGYALPSGHAQLVVAYWGLLAAWVGRNWFWALALVIMFLMGFSRVWLGVHYPTDVLAGWALGGLMLWGWLRWQPLWAERVGSLSPSQQWLGVVLAAVALLVLSALLGGEAGTYGAIGLMLGIAAAMIHGGRVLDLDGGSLWQRGGRFLLGMALLLGLLQLLPRALGAAGLPDAAMAFLITVILGAFFVYLPLFAGRLGLDRPREPAPASDR